MQNEYTQRQKSQLKHELV